MSKTKIIHQLNFESSDDYNIGLVRCLHKHPEYFLFYLLNSVNPFFFERKKDLLVSNKYYTSYHSVYEAISHDNRLHVQFFSNHPIECHQKKEISELFALDDHDLLLFPSQEIDYITKCSHNTDDFLLILQPENPIFQIEKLKLNSEDRLFEIIQYYE
ncbi:MAG: IPExxxVDY family protein [Bacteroidetes bacterium]|nr:IPExxxVDY family protein [Bacteroidota bacterium]